VKQPIIIGFILLIMLPQISKTALFIWFKVNQDAIAAELCINKENEKRPDCKGCCVLNEQLEKVEENPVVPASDTNKKEVTEILLVCCFNDISVEPIFPTNKKLTAESAEKNTSKPHLLKLIKPPAYKQC